jgi:mRNA-degrading endonuclease RelE of RelBE toxin-antitoxin system
MELATKNRRDAERVRTTVNAYARGGRADYKRLSGSRDARLRSGDWRIILRPQSDDSVLVLHVLNRRDAYE